MASSCIAIAGTNGNAYTRGTVYGNGELRASTKPRNQKGKKRREREAKQRKAAKIEARKSGKLPRGVRQYTTAEIAALNSTK